MQKIKTFLAAHEREYELIRYVIAGGLTTLLSLAVFSLVCVLAAPNHTVDGATQAQATAANVASWIIAVLFAFWINRRMVFLRTGGTAETILKELSQFVLSRLVSGLLFEIALFNLLAVLGVGNMANKLVILVLVTVFNYVVSKFWVFSKKPRSPQAPEADPAAKADDPERPKSAKD